MPQEVRVAVLVSEAANFQAQQAKSSVLPFKGKSEIHLLRCTYCRSTQTLYIFMYTILNVYLVLTYVIV